MLERWLNCSSLPDSFSVLVTALEASPEVPKMEVVTERLLHEEKKLWSGRSDGNAKAMTTKAKWSNKPKREEPRKHKSHSAIANDLNDSSNGEALVVSHADSVGASGSRIVDSGAMCHMCNTRQRFFGLRTLLKPENVTVGDGRSLEAVGRGSVNLLMTLPSSATQKCKLRDVLFVPDLSYNLVSVSKASEAGEGHSL